MAEVTAPQIKGLFHHLVRAAGGVEAAAAVLDVSAARISQWQGVTCPDVPSLLQVARLEAFVGHSIVLGALAKAATGNLHAEDLSKEAHEATYAAVDILKALDNGATDRELQALVVKARKELDEVEVAIAANAANAA